MFCQMVKEKVTQKKSTFLTARPSTGRSKSSFHPPSGSSSDPDTASDGEIREIGKGKRTSKETTSRSVRGRAQSSVPGRKIPPRPRIKRANQGEGPGSQYNDDIDLSFLANNFISTAIPFRHSLAVPWSISSWPRIA